MLCPKCHGKGEIATIVWSGSEGRYQHRSCNYPGCHNGQVDCCDGLQETPPKDTDREHVEWT